jgi:hypothetical protein
MALQEPLKIHFCLSEVISALKTERTGVFREVKNVFGSLKTAQKAF